jgi:hypothetical protein
VSPAARSSDPASQDEYGSFPGISEGFESDAAVLILLDGLAGPNVSRSRRPSTESGRSDVVCRHVRCLVRCTDRRPVEPTVPACGHCDGEPSARPSVLLLHLPRTPRRRLQNYPRSPSRRSNEQSSTTTAGSAFRTAPQDARDPRRRSPHRFSSRHQQPPPSAIRTARGPRPAGGSIPRPHW